MLSRELEETLTDFEERECSLLTSFERRQEDYVDRMDQLCFQRDAEKKEFLSEKLFQFKALMKPTRHDPVMLHVLLSGAILQG